MTQIPTVAIVRDEDAEYPLAPPFDPSEPYPELSGLPGGAPPLSPTPNPVFGLVREALATMGLDAERFGTAEWNPLRGMVPAGGLVVVKPNLVLESGRSLNRALTTHGSVVRAMITYVRLAGGPDVEILVGDVPLQGSDFDRLVEETGLRGTIDALRERGDARLVLHDLRRERAIVDESGFITRLDTLAGDPRGYVEVDVGAASRLEGLAATDFEAFAVSDYRPDSTVSAHATGVHRYLIPRSVLEADLVVNLPKLKTHQKAGLTVAMKNLVGINGDKARIPHFRVSAGKTGGDEYPPDYSRLWTLRSKLRARLQGQSRLLFLVLRQIWRVSKRFFLPGRKRGGESAGGSTLVAGGAWHGNDTLWRALHDLNYIVRFAGRDGLLHTTPQRGYLCVVDGIVAGEGDGPLKPIARTDGVVIAGDDALAIDLVAAHFMGLDWRRIPALAHALAQRPLWSRVRGPIESGGVVVRTPDGSPPPRARRPFLPPPGWVGHVELPDDADATEDSALAGVR